MASERTWRGAGSWTDALGDGVIGGVLAWSLLDLMSRWVSTSHFTSNIELSTFVLIGVLSTLFGRAVRGPASPKT